MIYTNAQLCHLTLFTDLLGVDNVPDNNELSRDEQQPDLVQLARAWYEENNATSAIIGARQYTFIHFVFICLH